MAYYVYGLFTRSDNEEKRYFYVGKTRRAVELRAREHKYRVEKGHEDLYAFLRHLEAAGVRWEEEVLRECGGSEYVPDAERFEVIRLLRLGHDLRNMRYGDASHRGELARQVNTIWIRDASDIAAARSIGKTRRAMRQRRKLQRRELERMLRLEGIPSVLDCGLLSGVMRRRLTRDGDMRVPKRFTLADLVHQARTYRLLDDLIAKMRAANVTAHGTRIGEGVRDEQQ
jgi:hypothetical protein